MKILVKTISIVISSLSLTLFFPLPTFAWNALGHMVVANIAYQQVTPAVRDKIDRMIAYLHNEYPEMGTYPGIATWADTLRSEKVETYTHWHYIDYGFANDGTPLKNVMDTDNAVWALKNIIPVVKYTSANPYERARFLAFLTHIVGDLHQPLHTVTNFSRKNPDGDRGGNSYYVRYKGDRVNLHKLWDEGVGTFEGDSSSSHVQALTNEIVAKYPESSLNKKSSDLNFDNWTSEGMSNAKQFVYDTPEDQQVSQSYVDAGKQVAQQQAALAGYRLARLLNQLLG
jgi:hypothetical protein